MFFEGELGDPLRALLRIASNVQGFFWPMKGHEKRLTLGVISVSCDDKGM